MLWVQIVSSVLLSVLVLLQAQSGGLGAAFATTAYHTKQGLEKTIFNATIITSLVFVISSVANLFI